MSTVQWPVLDPQEGPRFIARVPVLNHEGGGGFLIGQAFESPEIVDEVLLHLTMVRVTPSGVLSPYSVVEAWIVSSS